MQAKSGMGKTLIFSIAMLQRIDPGLNKCQAILVEPTRELAQQNSKVLTSLAQYMSGVKIHLAIGGTKIKQDRLALNGGAQILVGTIGRLMHLIEIEILGKK